MNPLTAGVVGIALISFVVYAFVNGIDRYNKKYTCHNLPGPALIPWVGRIHDLPIDFMWLKFKEWADIHGPIYRTLMLGANFVIISDEAIAEEILVKKAKVYSDRPEIKSLFDAKSTFGSMEYLPLMGKNQYWARQRKFTHAALIEGINAQYWGLMEFEAKRWMARLIENPDDFAFSLEDMCSKVMSKLVWDDDSLSVPLTPSAWGLLTQMSPAGPITNVLTPLWDWLPEPINPWKLRERKRHDTQQAFFMENYQRTRKLMETGRQGPCYTRSYLETAQKSNLSGDYEASCVLGMLALVGIFTVAGPLYYFLIAMVHHPEWQRKCQEEIDVVCRGLPPTIADMPNLPILRACIKETMRWKPTVPTGVAHEAEADDWFRGYFIPKGTRILPLDWAFVRNPTKYPDPDSYRPERWLETGWPTFQEPLTKYPTIVGMSSFGWGQRQCLGMSVTRDETVTGCGALMWAFNLKRKVNPTTGNEIEVPLDKSNSLLIIKPDPFEMAFEPRSAARKEEVLETWRVAEAKEKAERAEFLRRSEKQNVPT
ncbi:cytochrome P450 [Ampelomyces quisqualis]|uniref:Cytochrome P450 n=1 Tax=Ampelomyces quisqualis TaxID=50730 RepID=A0A6A5QFI8_AMPQU|nr:cytochrome P450 [Ampelomyces quisqualis]